MVRRRSRRRKSSYHDEDNASAAEVRTEDLSPRAKRLVESGVIDLTTVAGSGEDGRITSGDILERARQMEKDQSLARIEAIDPQNADARAPVVPPTPPLIEHADAPPVTPSLEPTSREAIEVVGAEPAVSESPDQVDTGEEATPDLPEPARSVSEWGTSTSVTEIGGEPIEVPPSPWDAYNGSTEGLSESALPGADQSWGEAEANIAAIAEEAAAQLYGRPPDAVPVVAPSELASPVEETSGSEVVEVPQEVASQQDSSPMPSWMPQAEVGVDSTTPPQSAEIAVPEPVPPIVATPASEVVEVPQEVASQQDSPPMPSWRPQAEVGVDSTTAPQFEEVGAPQFAGEEPDQEVFMDFGTLEQVDPASVWAEGAEYFAPWFLAHSKQLGDVLGLEAGLKDARQYTTKSASGVVGRDDHGEDVVVVSSEHAVAGDSDLGRALGMAASSGAATVALVSARFEEEQLQALTWLNSQTKSGVKWFGIEMKVVRIADSPAAMLFELVSSPSGPPA